MFFNNSCKPVHMISKVGQELKDGKTNFSWKMYEKNPTSYFRFMEESIDKHWKVPSYEVLTNFLFDLSTCKDETIIKSLPPSCNLLTSSTFKSIEGDTYFKSIKWVSEGDNITLEESNVSIGDLVYILLLKNEK